MESTASQVTELVQKARQGDREACARLFATYGPMAMRCALAMSNGNAADAEDLTQEAFVNCFMHLAELREPKFFGAWLLRSIRNLGINRSQSGRSRQRVLGDLQSQQDSLVPGPADPFQLYQREQRAALLREIFEEMEDSPMKETARLFYLEDLSCDEVGERLGTPKNTVTTRLDRFRQQLRKRLLARLVLPASRHLGSREPGEVL